MGYALAEECAGRGAEVTLVSGPVTLKAGHPRIKIVPVESAQEMYEASTSLFKEMNVAILCAAVADFTPCQVASSKIKRKKEDMILQLKPTLDIAASLGSLKRENQRLIGFALETDDEELNAISKMERKNLDFIVLNSLRNPGAGFRTDTNQITIIDKSGKKTDFPLKSKQEAAKDIVDYLVQYEISRPENDKNF
jgi:phosphopantothenoylcysteine decarboxylase/phosphopantothenate--cysteine ligase